MRVYLAFVFCAGLMLGCRAAGKVAVSSYHVATAPVRLVARQFDDQTEEPDRPAQSEERARPSPAPTSRPTPRATPTKEHPPQVAAKSKEETALPPSAAEFPTAKPVPEKPGYVFSPYESGKYVDVSGYAPGSKVKDPYSKKIFIVP